MAGENLWPHSAAGWWVLGGVALISHAGGQGLIAVALARLPAALVIMGLLLQPVTAAVIAALWLHEPLGPAQIAGMALVLGGVLAARRETA